MTKIAYSYIRFSTKAQVTDASIAVQIERTRAYAAKHGYDLQEKSFKDLGASGFTGENLKKGSGLSTFLELVENGTIERGSTLIIENLDRLSRANPWDAQTVFMSIVNSGITVVTLADEQVYTRKEKYTANDTMAIFASLMVLVRAHEESASKSDRAKKGIRKNLMEGVKAGKCPTWLKSTPDKRDFIILDEQANIVREVFKMRTESIGAHRIAKHLNTTYGWKWSAPQVVRLLMNPSVIGTRLSQAGYEPRLEYYPAIVDKTVFYGIQRLMSAGIGTKRGRRAEDEPNLFTGLLFCAHCEGRMRFFRANRNVTQRYVKCENALNSLCGVEGYVNYDVLESEVIGWLLLDQDEEVLTLVDKKPTLKVVASAEVQALKDAQSKLIDLAASGLMNTRMVTEKLNALEMQIQHHEAAAVVEPEVDDRMFAEKAWALVERHDDELLAVADGESPEKLHAVRRELKTAFQRSVERINVFEEVREANEHQCKFSVQFRGYDGAPERAYTRPALNHVKGAWNKGKST